MNCSTSTTNEALHQLQPPLILLSKLNANKTKLKALNTKPTFVNRLSTTFQSFQITLVS